MSKGLLFVGDIHLGAGSYPKGESGVSVKDELTLKILSRLFSNMKKIDAVVFLGDIYDNPRPSEELQIRFNDQMAELLGIGLEVLIIVGNHDMTARVHALEPLKELVRDRITIVTKPELHRVAGFELFCIPWSIKWAALGWDKGFEAIMPFAEKLPKVINSRLLAGHLPIDGCFVGSSNYRLDRVGASKEQLDALLTESNCDLGFFGHYHHAQDILDNKAIYVGSVDRIDFGEKDEQKIVCVVTERNSFITVKEQTVNATPMSYVRSVNEIDELLDSDLDGHLVKVALKNVSRSFADTFDRSALRKKILAAGAAYVLPITLSVEASASSGESVCDEKYGGALEVAVVEWVKESFPELSDTNTQELTNKALELLGESDG